MPSIVPTPKSTQGEERAHVTLLMRQRKAKAAAPWGLKAFPALSDAWLGLGGERGWGEQEGEGGEPIWRRFSQGAARC